MTRREFLGAASAAAGTAALNLPADVPAALGAAPLSPAINPLYLTGSRENWPLAELAALGYRGLELTPACVDHTAAWKPAADKVGLRPLAVNALPELRPYLTGSLTDAVAWRRRDTLQRLQRALRQMQSMGIPFLIVAPSRLAENYQSVDQARALLIEGLRELAAAGSATILLEAAPFRLFTASAEIAALVDEVARPNVAAALDLGHALLAGERPAQAAAVLGPRLQYVQLNDADVRPGLPRLDRHLPVGAGSLDATEARAAIADRPVAVCISAPSGPLTVAREALQWLK